MTYLDNSPSGPKHRRTHPLRPPDWDSVGFGQAISFICPSFRSHRSSFVLCIVIPFMIVAYYGDHHWSELIDGYLVGGLEFFFLFSHILGIIIPIESNWLIFFRGVQTTNQSCRWSFHPSTRVWKQCHYPETHGFIIIFSETAKKRRHVTWHFSHPLQTHLGGFLKLGVPLNHPFIDDILSSIIIYYHLLSSIIIYYHL